MAKIALAFFAFALLNPTPSAAQYQRRPGQQIQRRPAQTTTTAPAPRQAAPRPTQQQQQQPQAQPSEGAARAANVDRLKQQYWRKDEAVDVVQNRAYSKRRKLETYLFAGTTDADPFLEIRNAGGSLGYHFNEYWSVHALYWAYFVSDSSALTQLKQQTGATAATNRPDAYYGGELVYSVVYGKLSLAGKSILYYDLHLLGGGGMTGTQTGDNFTFHFGIGQQTYVTNYLALRLDYRRLHSKEKVSPASPERTAWSDMVTLGATFLFPSFF